MKNFCKKHSLSEDQFFGKEEIKVNLNLSSLTSIPRASTPRWVAAST
jgi:hypothetical protein